MEAFRIAFAATLGYALAVLMFTAAIFIVGFYGWPLMERTVHARYEASHAAWCAERAGSGATEIGC